MDHATRHLSSPSPTSSFLFHHSEKNYKSSPDLLAPLLSSETEDSDVNACLSTTVNESTAFASYSPSQSDEDSSAVRYDLHKDVLPTDSTLSTEKLENVMQSEAIYPKQTDVSVNLEQDTSFDAKGTCSSRQEIDLNNNTNNNGRNDIAVEDDDDEEDDEDEDDENMRNVLSGSSRSSATTMPLLTEAHTHHSFSERISLEEYSPLSLVNDCDNALPLSPTSLACGSHHSSFKSSLNNLKIDHLGVDGVSDVGDHGVDDVVGDTRSMSPSLLSNQGSHHNLWSNSSTAITQNPSLLTSTSTSILLSHHQNQHSHHHHQINTLMQQLEPQSLDEAPPLVGGDGSSSALDPELAMNQHAQHLLHRPSSEPPLNSGLGILGSLELRSYNGLSAVSSISKISSTNPNGRSRKQSSSVSANLSSPSSGSTSSKLAATGSASSSSTSSRSSSGKARNSRSRTRNTKSETAATVIVKETGHSADQNSLNSKLHLQLNHHEKLKELQQRLFGSLPSTSDTNSTETNNASDFAQNTNGLDEKLSVSKDNSIKVNGTVSGSSAIADSSVCKDTNTMNSSSDKTVASNQSRGTMTKNAQQSISKRKRPSRNGGQNKDSSTTSDFKSDEVITNRSNHRSVKAETAEPDTTTKSSDCLKLADLLSSNSGLDFARSNGNFGIMFGSDTASRTGGLDNVTSNNERTIQHIQQMQTSPSLTVVANGNGLIQPINIQHQLQLGSNENGQAIGNLGHQIINQCQPSTALAASNGDGNSSGSIDPVSNQNATEDNKNINSEIQNGLVNSSADNSNTNQVTASHLTPAIGTHQIAIQVICQDGTSLVLPVSSSSGLNTAVALSAHNQAQLKSLLSNNGNNSVLFTNCQQTRPNGTQMFPVVSMVNAHNQSAIGGVSNLGTSAPAPSGSSIGPSASGLAASSPTLAALLDAGTNRSSLDSQNASQSIISGNLLRRIVTNSSLNQNLGDDPTGTNGSLNGPCSTAKKIKLDTDNVGNSGVCTATFTIIDPQGLCVTTGNENSTNYGTNISNNKNFSDIANGAEQVSAKVGTKLTSSGMKQDNESCANSVNQQSISTRNTGSCSGETGVKSKSNHECSTNNKQVGKMTSSTGNRQVDPAQPFRCEHCNSTFTRLGNFTRHKKIHTVPTKDGQRFKCDVCSKSFLQRCDLARHLHIHRGTEPHRCNICGKGYIRHSDLVTHQRFHNKEKPFGCPHCSKGFCQRGDLNRHLRSIHLQMKPILCPCCNRKFAKQETLLRHLNTAHRGNNKITLTTTSNQDVMSGSASLFDSSGQNNKNELMGASSSIAMLSSKSASGASDALNEDVGDSQSNGSLSSQKSSANASVASLQAIQATLCRVQNSVDSSRKVKVVVSDGLVNSTKATS